MTLESEAPELTVDERIALGLPDEVVRCWQNHPRASVVFELADGSRHERDAAFVAEVVHRDPIAETFKAVEMGEHEQAKLRGER